MTDEQLKQIEQWYSDPVRKLPRKVVADVAALVAEVRRLQPKISRDPAIESLAKALVGTPIGKGMLLGAALGALAGALPPSTGAGRAGLRAVPPPTDTETHVKKLLDLTCGAPFVNSPDYKGSPTDRATDSDVFCTRLKGHDGLHCHEPWKKDFA